ncbi:hypothetical protein CEXT_575401 [Caerostris extrusa]|uniref:Uncharacterized protein n=1 Tax=Caerostris extrusa TaxID=172846 RepID=A0AAV4Y5R4_CAEEX|nr:hypothetical protein CEXT_575401 [Caerostris extrusa]
MIIQRLITNKPQPVRMEDQETMEMKAINLIAPSRFPQQPNYAFPPELRCSISALLPFPFFGVHVLFPFTFDSLNCGRVNTINLPSNKKHINSNRSQQKTSAIRPSVVLLS